MGGYGVAVFSKTSVYYFAELFFIDQKVYFKGIWIFCPVYIAEVLRNVTVEYESADRRMYYFSRDIVAFLTLT